MAFHTPHGSARFRLPWSWSSFDYRELCAALWEQADARFEIAQVRGRTGDTVHTDRGDLTAPLIVDALGWRRVLGAGANVQPPEALISRGLEVHPHDGRGTDLDVWIDRSVVRYGYAWSVPAGGERRDRRRLLRAAPPRQGADPGDGAPAGQPRPSATRATGSRTSCDRRPRTACSSSATRPATASRCRARGFAPRSTSGSPAGRELRAVLAGEKRREQALAAYGAFSDAHAPFFRRALRLQRLIPALPPRALTALLAVMGRERPCRRAFNWYLEQARP